MSNDKNYGVHLKVYQTDDNGLVSKKNIKLTEGNYDYRDRSIDVMILLKRDIGISMQILNHFKVFLDIKLHMRPIKINIWLFV